MSMKFAVLAIWLIRAPLALAGPPTLNASLGRIGSFVTAASNDATVNERPMNSSTAELNGGRSSPIAVRLDLRPPELNVDDGGERAAGFTSTRPSAPADRDLSTSADTSGGRPMSRAEEFTHRVRQEGLPLARLWQSKSAFISLGLNRKGKPGLWLIQKTR
jgi:hypothetical protein